MRFVTNQPRLESKNMTLFGSDRRLNRLTVKRLHQFKTICKWLWDELRPCHAKTFCFLKASNQSQFLLFLSVRIIAPTFFLLSNVFLYIFLVKLSPFLIFTKKSVHENKFCHVDCALFAGKAIQEVYRQV